MKNTWLNRRAPTSRKKPERLRKSKRLTSRKLLKRTRFLPLSLLSETKISTMLELLRQKETLCLPSKLPKISFPERKDKEVAEAEGVEVVSLEEEEPELELQVGKENPEVLSISMLTMRNSPLYERRIVKSTFETNQERLK